MYELRKAAFEQVYSVLLKQVSKWLSI